MIFSDISRKVVIVVLNSSGGARERERERGSESGKKEGTRERESRSE